MKPKSGDTVGFFMEGNFRLKGKAVVTQVLEDGSIFGTFDRSVGKYKKGENLHIRVGEFVPERAIPLFDVNDCVFFKHQKDGLVRSRIEGSRFKDGKWKYSLVGWMGLFEENTLHTNFPLDILDEH